MYFWRSSQPSLRLGLTLAGGLSLLQVAAGPALAQSNQSQQSINLSPNTGTSTLDQLKPARADSVELDFPSGFRCKAGGGDVPSLVFYGDRGQFNAFNNSTQVEAGRLGAAIVLPLYRSKANSCDQAMKLQNALSQLEIAEKLVSSGAMTNEEYLNLARRIKATAFGG